LYNPSIGKFLSVDPLSPDYPWYTPYQFAGNMPISAIDLDGLEIFFAADGKYIDRWGESIELRILEESDVANFAYDLRSVRLGHATGERMFYWSGEGSSHFSGSGFLRKALMRFKISIKNVISEETFVNQHNYLKYKVDKDCWDMSEKTVNLNGFSPQDEDDYFEEGVYLNQMYFDVSKLDQIKKHIEDNGGEMLPISESQLNGFRVINSELEAGRPLIVGLDGWPTSSNDITDMTSDHFIVLTGRGIDKNGKLYFSGWENGWGTEADAKNATYNRFYPQADGTLRGYTTEDPNEGTDSFPLNPTKWIITTIRKMKKNE